MEGARVRKYETSPGPSETEIPCSASRFLVRLHVRDTLPRALNIPSRAPETGSLLRSLITATISRSTALDDALSKGNAHTRDAAD